MKRTPLKRSEYRPKRPQHVMVSCRHCKCRFETEPFPSRKRIYCSRKCSSEARAKRPTEKRPPKGAAWGCRVKGESHCRACGAPARHLHHIVPRGIAPKHKTNLLNGLPLCVECHMGWHARTVTISAAILKPEEKAFVIGISSVAWLERNYRQVPHHFSEQRWRN